MAPHVGTSGQLSRDERVQLYGIDCDDQVTWLDWTPGIESVQDLVLQNVALVTQKVKFQLPGTKEFDMPYPEPFKLAPGMKKTIPISFRPSKYEPHLDRVQILTKGGSFFVTVKALVKDIALTVPHFFDFGLCPTMELSQQQIEIYNTGTLKAAIRWHSRQPFTVRCPVDVLEVGQSVRCSVDFEPHSASVFDGLLICEASAASEALSLEDGSGQKQAEGKQYRMQCTGVGKMPHLCLPHGSSSIVEFGSVCPGARAPQTLEILNTTPVRAAFKVQAMQEDGEVSPLPPAPFFVSPESGVVDPACTFKLTFYFQSHTVKEKVLQRFQITTPGGTPLVVTCKAFCKPMEVRLSARSINFGEVPSGKVYSRTLQLHNSSDRPAMYHFVNLENMRGVFWIDRHAGVIPPDSFMVVTVFFGPLAPINYCKQVSCLIKGALAPLTLHLLGSAHTEKARPARLDQHHVDTFRNMQLSGIREYQLPEGEQEQQSSEDAPEAGEAERTMEVPVKPVSATATFLELMLPTDSKLRDISISPGILDFGSCSVLTMSEKRVVTITNRTSQKVTVQWMVVGETRMPCSADDKALFSVYPLACDIKPRGQADFQVSFRPQHNGKFDGEMLEVVVNQKANRTFRLVDLARFTPPWTLSVKGLGHTMGSMQNDPLLDISEGTMRFRACHPGERSYQVAMLTNPGDTCVAYSIIPPIDASGQTSIVNTLKDLKDQVPFRAWPTHGIIPPHQFHLVVLEFAPTAARNDVAYAAHFKVVVDYNEGQPKTIRVSGRCWLPQLSFGHGLTSLTFPPTCSGIASTMTCKVKNSSEIPIAFECRIPTRFRSNFWFEEPSGKLAPSATASLVAHFCPTGERVFSAPLYCFTRCLEDPESNLVEGPLRSLLPFSSLGDREPSYVLQLVGHGKQPALALDPAGLDLGPVKVGEEVHHQITILNSSNLTVHYTISSKFRGDLPAGVGEDALKLLRNEGSVAGRCTEALQLVFAPKNRGLYEYQVEVVPKSNRGRSTKGRSVALDLRADVQYPFIQIADLRTECASMQPQSMMWMQFQVDGINELYRGEVAEQERRFQAAIGIDEKKRLVSELKPFQLLFGTAAVGSSPTVVYLVLSNPSRLRVKFSFQTPKNLALETTPYWCDEKSLIDDREAHFAWVEEHGIYDIQPRTGEIMPGDFLHVKMTYYHQSIGTHILPVVFNVHDGRSLLFYFKAHSVAPNVGCLSVRSSVVQLQPVLLNVAKGPVQPVELSNSGAVAAPWRVDLQSIREHNAQNYNFEVLSVWPLEGVLKPQSSTFLHFTFTPLEAKSYVCPVRIEMMKDGRPAEELLFELRAVGVLPGNPLAKVEPFFPENLPLQTYAPVPCCGAALSIEMLDFGKCPVRAVVSRMLVLVNYTSEFVLSFRWDVRQLFRSDSEMEIEPSFGELSPGSHCIITFRLFCEDSVDLSGEVACHLGWTHISSYSARAIEQQEEVTAPAEYLAFQRDHNHQFKKSIHHSGHHISVANRLTVSRFRQLMSCAAGQKFLNENLNRTSVLSSYMPSMSPKRAMEVSTLGRFSQQQEDHPGLGAGSAMSIVEGPKAPQPPAPPNANPLFVRLRAFVADTEVLPEDRSNFLVLGLGVDGKTLSSEKDDGALDDLQDPQDVSSRSVSKGMHADRASGDRTPMSHSSRPLMFMQGGARSSAPSQASRQPEGRGTGSNKTAIGAQLIGGTLEHIMREVLSEESFHGVMDDMLLQDTPFFVQFDDSPPPGEAFPHPQAEIADEDAEPEWMSALSSSSTKPSWRSGLLMDFEAPPSASAPSRPSADLTVGESGSDDGPGRFWKDARENYGDVDLEAFHNSAGEVLDKLLLDMMDDVVAGRLNWMRPLPRARARSRRR